MRDVVEELEAFLQDLAHGIIAQREPSARLRSKVRFERRKLVKTFEEYRSLCVVKYS